MSLTRDQIDRIQSALHYADAATALDAIDVLTANEALQALLDMARQQPKARVVGYQSDEAQEPFIGQAVRMID